MNQKQPALPALTGLRFFVALWVVFAHGSSHWRPGMMGSGAVDTFLSHGGDAVIVFFVLSGFVLGYSYLAQDGSLRGSVLGFYRARVARIVPVYWSACLLGLAPYMLWNGDLPASVCPTMVPRAGVIAASFGMVQEWLPGNAICLNNPAWSLSCEALFYAVFPLAAFALGPRSARELLLVGVALWLTVVTFGMPPAPTPIALLPTFLAGICFGRIFRLAGTALVRPVVWRTVTPFALVAALATALAIDIAGGAMWGVPVFALLLYALAQRQGLLAALLAQPLLVALGEASYALYILHWPILEWVTHLTGRAFGAPADADPQAWPLFAAYLVLTVAVSLLVHAAIERPAQRAILAWRWHRRPALGADTRVGGPYQADDLCRLRGT